MRKHLECTDLCLGVDDEQVEGLWAQIKEQVSKGDTAVGTYYRLPDKVEEGDEAFSGQLGASSKSQAWVLVRDFICPEIFWRSSTAKHKQSWRFL